jgi:hypothetical protein
VGNENRNTSPRPAIQLARLHLLPGLSGHGTAHCMAADEGTARQLHRCMAACRGFAGLATVRFLLGVFEAGILPALLLVNSLWYTRREQPLRTALWYNTFAGVSEIGAASEKLVLTCARSLAASSVLRLARLMVHCLLGRFGSCSCVLPG